MRSLKAKLLCCYCFSAAHELVCGEETAAAEVHHEVAKVASDARSSGRSHEHTVEGTLVSTASAVIQASLVSEGSAEQCQLIPADKLLRNLTATAILGLGSMGTVYKGTYQGAPAALKFMFSEAPMLAPATSKELTVAMHLRHPNIVSTFTTRCAVITQELLQSLEDDAAADSESAKPDPHQEQAFTWFDVFQRGGAVPGHTVVVIVQELCGSGTLADAIAAGMFAPRPSWPQQLIRRVVLRTAADVCRGMVHMHECGVLHGDLKPANVLLARSLNDRRGFLPKVADFGLSRVLRDASASWVQSSPQGTCRYMAPEAFRGAFHRASDVYAFGMMLFDLAFGRRPFAKLNNVQIMMGVAEGTLQPDWPDAEWPELCALGRRCTARDPRARPSFTGLAEELAALEAAVRASRDAAGSRAAAVTQQRQMAADPPAAPPPPPPPPPPPVQQSGGGGAAAAASASAGHAAAGLTTTSTTTCCSEQQQQQQQQQAPPLEAPELPLLMVAAAAAAAAARARGLKPPPPLLLRPLPMALRRRPGSPASAADVYDGRNDASGAAAAAAVVAAALGYGGAISEPLTPSAAGTNSPAARAAAAAAAMPPSEGAGRRRLQMAPPPPSSAVRAAAVALLFSEVTVVDATPSPRQDPDRAS